MFKKRLLWDLHGYSKSDVPTLFFKLIIFIYLFIYLQKMAKRTQALETTERTTKVKASIGEGSL